jgi:soluble lytic murein transglycosylase
MKENIRILSFSALLLASSSLLSQTTEIKNTVIRYKQADPHRFDAYLDNKDSASTKSTNSTVLATIEDYTDHKHDGRLADIIAEHNNQQTEASVNKNQLTDEQIEQLRPIFLQAEKAVSKKNNRRFLSLSEQLIEYPLYPYLQYQWLQKNLDKSDQIESFLEQNKTSRYAGKLKRKWLNHLGKNRQWPLFLQHYTQSNEAGLRCYYYRALHNSGNKPAALNGARELWSVGYSQPRQCDPLFTALKDSSLFTEELLWKRFDAALQNNKVKLATYVKSLMPESEQATAQLWLNLHRKPDAYMQQLLSREKNSLTALMFRHAINRLSRHDISSAIDIWDKYKQDFNVEKKLADKLEKQLAFKLVFKGESGAYERLSQLDVPDDSSKAWRIRVALSEQNWPNVLAAIQALDESDRESEKWQYWMARAYLETGKVEQAQQLFSELSRHRSFYGYLAADKVNSMYQLSDRPVDIPEEKITALKNRKEFTVAAELMQLDRITEAKLQWWHAVGQLDNNTDIITAAKLARTWNWDEVAIFTIAKAKYWDDLELRFPLSYADKIHQNSEKQKLNPAILFGLIRRESAFNEKAHSPAGARGLMQIMPKTARSIAKQFNERWRGSSSLYNPVTNLKYGSYYYQKLLDQFDGHYALALAAYNAGPHRVKQWLPESGSMPADIWIETIPFHETRDYVRTVIAYALIYQQRTQSEELSMNDFTQDIQPLNSNN